MNRLATHVDGYERRHRHTMWASGRLLLLLLLPLLCLVPATDGCSAAPRRQTRESQSAGGPGRWRVGLPAPRAEARVAGPFLLPAGDDGADDVRLVSADDVRLVSVDEVEAAAASLDVPEPESYAGEAHLHTLTQQCPNSVSAYLIHPNNKINNTTIKLPIIIGRYV